MATSAATGLLSQADRLARLMTTLSRAFARELATTLRDLERQIRAWAVQRGATGLISAARAAVLREELRSVLRAAGYAQMIDDASAAATERVLTAVRGRRDVAAVGRFATTDLARLEALQSGFLRNVVPTEEELLAPLWRTVTYSMYSGRARAELVEDLADVIDKTEAQAATLYDTAVQTLTRHVQDAHRDQRPDGLLLYAGPADVRLRPFCADRVGKIYTRADVEAMDNGQLPDVLTTGGGYNCRHVWMSVPFDSPLAALHGTGDRVPEVARALEGLPRRRQKAA